MSLILYLLKFVAILWRQHAVICHDSIDLSEECGVRRWVLICDATWDAGQ